MCIIYIYIHIHTYTYIYIARQHRCGLGRRCCRERRCCVERRRRQRPRRTRRRQGLPRGRRRRRLPQFSYVSTSSYVIIRQHTSAKGAAEAEAEASTVLTGQLMSRSWAFEQQQGKDCFIRSYQWRGRGLERLRHADLPRVDVCIDMLAERLSRREVPS